MTALEPAWIDHASAVSSTARTVRAVGWMALDTEADSYHAYFHKLCLIQISAGPNHFVLDPFALDGAALAPVLELIEDPHITVYMHGADYDMRVLDRDLATHPRGIEDTQIMAQLLGEPRTGLAALLAKEFSVELDKRFQRADWSRRPLTTEMLSYAAADTAYLRDLADRLKKRLEAAGRWDWALEEFRALENVRYQPPVKDPLAFERLKGARRLNGAARDRLFSLYEWREQEARRRDVSPFRVLSNAGMLALAENAPDRPARLKNLKGVGPTTAQRYGTQLLGVLREPAPAPHRQRPVTSRALSSTERRRLKRLQSARDRISAEIGIDSGVLCPKSILETVARRQPPPSSIEDLARCELEGWRLKAVGPALLEATREENAGHDPR